MEKQLRQYLIITCIAVAFIVLLTTVPKNFAFNNAITPEEFLADIKTAENVSLNEQEIVNHQAMNYTFQAPKNFDVKINIESSSDISNITTNFKLIVDPLVNETIITTTNNCLATNPSKETCFTNSYFDLLIKNTNFVVQAIDYDIQDEVFVVLVQDQNTAINYVVLVQDDAYITWKFNEKTLVTDFFSATKILTSVEQ